jgi:hypothetical protein
MIHATNMKAVAVTSPAAIVDNAAFTTNTIDTLGFRYIQIIVLIGALDIALAVFKLRQSDDSGMSGATDVPGADFSVDGTLPSATDDNLLFAINVDMRGKKRYLDVSITGGDGSVGTYLSAIALLSRGEESPNSVSERGFSQELTV